MSNTGLDRGNTSILASGDESGIIIIWDMKSGKPVSYIGNFFFFFFLTHKRFSNEIWCHKIYMDK